MTYFLLGLGSNIKPLQNLPAAILALEAAGDIVSQSPLVVTEPVGETFHDEFGNQLVILASSLPAPMLKHKLQKIEENMGREPKSPSRKMRDRTIDIDILGEAQSAAEARALVPEESYYAEVYAQWNQLENV